jgi:hypothetical protein
VSERRPNLLWSLLSTFLYQLQLSTAYRLVEGRGAAGMMGGLMRGKGAHRKLAWRRESEKMLAPRSGENHYCEYLAPEKEPAPRGPRLFGRKNARAEPMETALTRSSRSRFHPSA